MQAGSVVLSVQLNSIHNKNLQSFNGPILGQLTYFSPKNSKFVRTFEKFMKIFFLKINELKGKCFCCSCEFNEKKMFEQKFQNFINLVKCPFRVLISNFRGFKYDLEYIHLEFFLFQRSKDI